MFHRILVTEWMNGFALLSFAIFFLIFLATAAWALTLPRERVNHLENLPLETEPKNDESNL